MKPKDGDTRREMDSKDRQEFERGLNKAEVRQHEVHDEGVPAER